MAIEFFHLHTHMSHSVLDGLGSPERWVREAAGRGMSALAMTDHASVSGYVEFMKAAKGTMVKPIVGCEFYFCSDAAEKTKGETRNHVTVLAKDWDGFCSIMDQLTLAHEQFYYKPRLGLGDLFGFKNCVVMTGCAIGILSRPDWLKLTQDLFDTYGDDFYLEIMPHAFSDQYEVNRRASSAAALMGTKVVATNDCHYPLKEDALTHEVLLAVQTGGKWDDPKRFRFGFDGLYLRNLAEMAEAFKRQEERFPIADQLLQALKAPAEIVEKCNVEAPRIEMELPRIFEDEEGQLRRICARGWKEKIAPFIPPVSQKVYRDRLIREMQLIRRMGFVRYFLMVWDIASYSRSRGIFVGPGRGSVGGSLVAYLTDLHHVDPIRMKLHFERFINLGRIDLPDIDLDFQADRREEVFAYIERRYGKGNVAHISTNGVLQRKSAFRDVARVFGVPPVEIDSLSKTVENDIPLEEQLVLNPDLRDFAGKHPVVIPTAEALTGQIRSKGLHAAGVIVSASGFSGRAVLERRDSARAVNWDMKECDQFGLIKIDILGLRNLTILQDAANMVKERKGIEIDYKAVRLDDPKVLDVFSQAHTVGIFQFEGYGISGVLKRVAPIEDFETLVHVNALYRPGPKGSGILDQYVENRHRGFVSYFHKIHKEITKETYGGLIFQEQVMEIFHRMAGFTWAEADTVRKVISKSMGEEEFAKHKSHFIEGCANNGIEKSLAAELFSDLANFSQYAFNKSHSAEYALIAYWTAYMKAYHPHEFMTALLSTMLGSEEEEMKRSIGECRRLGIRVLTPDVNKSGVGYVLDGAMIYTGFARIKNVGTKAADAIVKAREAGPFADIWDFLGRVERRSVNSLVVKHLIYAGAFDGIHPGGNRTLVENLETICKGEKELKGYPEWSSDVLLRNKAGVLKGVYTTAFDDVKMKMKPPGPEIKSLKDALAACRKCKLAETATQPVPPEYTRNSKLFCLAEAPGGEEDKLVRPLIGPAGKKFMAILQEETGLTRSWLFLMHTYSCWPGKGNALPEDLENTCYEHVEFAIKVMKPTVILCMGNVPLKFLTGKNGGIQSLSGQYEYLPTFGAVVVYCVHPASIFRDPENDTRFRKAIRTLKKYL